jgi:phospholipase/carboxylesterase
MMALQVGIKRKEEINCLIGYSGKIINKKNLSNNINSKPKVFLMHGAEDTIVSPTYLLEAKEYLNKFGIKTKTKIFNNCQHHIPVEGTSLGLEFLRKNLL